MTLNLVKGRFWKGGACTKPVLLGQATGTSTTCPSGTGRLGQAVLVWVGQVVLVSNLSHWDWERSKETFPCPMDKSYTLAGGLSLSQDKPYDHDGTCPSPTCPILSHKVWLHGSAIFGPFSQTHISKRVFMSENSSSALLDIQLTLHCICEVDSFLPDLEHL